MARGKIDTDNREDETAVYKPVKPKKSAVKAEAPKEEKKTEDGIPLLPDAGWNPHSGTSW